MSKRILAISIATLVALLLASLASLAFAGGQQPDKGGKPKPIQHWSADQNLIDATRRDSRARPTPPRAARARNLTQVGFNALGGGGFNTDVWAQGNFAYVGTWGAFTPEGLFCPNDGTKVVDISNPADPVQVNTLPAPSGTQTNDIKVANVNTAFFHGDLLVVSNEDCQTPGARGFELWDVTNPAGAVFLARFGPVVAFDTPEFFDIGFGVHNTFIFEQGDRAYVAAVVDFGEALQLLFDLPIIGDLRIVDVTDPRHPVQVGDWGIVKNLGLNPFEGQGEDFAFKFLHDVWVEKNIAYLSYWDAGLILVDVSDPSDPQFMSQTPYPPSEEGNTHVAVPAQGGNLVVTGDEDFTPGPWGFMRVFDALDATHLAQVGSFGTANTFGPRPDAGDYSIHNVVVRGSSVYASWYSDGIRVVDISAPAAPREIASFVPPDLPDPVGFFPAKALVWGVYVQDDLVFASDINGGLYILKHVP